MFPHSTFVLVIKTLNSKYNSRSFLINTVSRHGGCTFIRSYQEDQWWIWRWKPEMMSAVCWNSPPSAKVSSVSRAAPHPQQEPVPTILCRRTGKRQTAKDQTVERGQEYLRKMNWLLMRHWILNDNRVFMRGHLRWLMNNRGTVAVWEQDKLIGLWLESVQPQNNI